MQDDTAGGLVPVSQHVAVWDLHRGTGRVCLFSGDEPLAHADLSDAADFRALVAMLSDPRGLWFDGAREVLRRSPEGTSSAGGRRAR